MNSHYRLKICCWTALLMLALTAAGLRAATPQVRRHVIAGGGALHSAGNLHLRGTSAQSGADFLAADQSSIHWQGGYWAVPGNSDNRIFANDFE
jgi:hypothetical protein